MEGISKVRGWFGIYLLFFSFAAQSVPQNSPELNVLAFGADPTANKDSTAAFRAACAANTNRGSVYIPPGVYLVTAPVNLRSGRLYGDGEASEVIFRSAGHGFWATNCHDIVVENIKLGGACSRPIFFHYVTNAVIRHCIISGATASKNRRDVVAAISLEAVEDCMIDSNRTFGNGTGTTNIPSTAEIHGGFSGCKRVRVVNNTLSGFRSFFGALFFNAIDCSFEDNYIDQGNSGETNFASGYGIAVYQTTNSVILPRGNRIVRNRIRNTAGTGIYLNRGTQYVVNGNSLDTVAQKMTDRFLPVSGIGLNGITDSQITSNAVFHSGRGGISIATCTNIVVLGNHVNSTINEGIELRGACDSLQLIGNSLTFCGRGGISGRTSGTHLLRSVLLRNQIRAGTTDGIRIPSAENCFLRSNLIEEIDGPAILIQAGTGNTVTENEIYTCTTEGISTACSQSIFVGNRIAGSGLAAADAAGWDNAWIGNLLQDNRKNFIQTSGAIIDWFAIPPRQR